jgi:hypothetical protein
MPANSAPTEEELVKKYLRFSSYVRGDYMYTKLLNTRLGLIRGDRKNKIPAVKPKSFSQGETHSRTSPTRQPEIRRVFYFKASA